MIKKCSYFIGTAVLVMVTGSAFTAYESETMLNAHFKVSEALTYHVPTEKEHLSELASNTKTTATPITGKSFIGFKEALAIRESQGDYKIVNSYGYMGKYQFGKETLKIIGVKNTQKFLKDPVLQEKAFVAYLQKNKWILRKEIAKYDGKVVGGVFITESGILAAAHLGGAGAVKKYLRSNGSQSFTDGYGTNIKSYLKKFSGFDVNDIQPHKMPTI